MTLSKKRYRSGGEANDVYCYSQKDLKEALREFKEKISLSVETGDIGLKMQVRFHRWIDEIFGDNFL